LKVRKGDDVTAGQVLALLENRDVLAQRQEASAAIADAQANLQKTSAGTLPTDIERARGQLAGADAALNLAQKVCDRRTELYKQGAIPQRDLLQSQAELLQAKANYEVSQKSLELLRNQSAEKDIAMARSRVQQAEARLAQINAQLQYAELRSPFAGTITEQFQFPGDMAQPGTPSFTVMDLSVVIARAQVPEAQIGAVRTGQACRFKPADPNQGPADGRVTVINKAVDPARRTVEVWCEIQNGARKLRANVFGNLETSTGTSSGVSVPQAAVQFAEGSRSGIVMVVDQKNTAHKREIEAGETVDGQVQILKGVNAGEIVVTEGGYGLPEGAEVRTGERAK
jgi:multidrug efflux pump subunit AcrA (membrane-fusion protein)